eukprot:scaffold193_cov255-Pinguiococcus_pyrenoidosus.AAC.4
MRADESHSHRCMPSYTAQQESQIDLCPLPTHWTSLLVFVGMAPVTLDAVFVLVALACSPSSLALQNRGVVFVKPHAATPSTVRLCPAPDLLLL